MEKIVDWLLTDNCFSWFCGNGFAFIICALSFAWIISVLVSKKIKNIFF
jgi:hypothetical protein